MDEEIPQPSGEVQTEQPPEAEEKPIEDIEFSTMDGRVTWRKRYGDRSVGVWNHTLIESNDKPAIVNKRRQLLQEFGLDKRERQQA